MDDARFDEPSPTAASPPRRRRARSGVGSVFVLGSLFGVMLATLVSELWPDEVESDVAHYREVREFVRSSFVGDIDADRLVEHALEGLVKSLDPYSRYYDNPVSTAQVDRETSGHYTGIGVVFMPQDERNGFQVLFPVSGSPAARTGLRVGDRLVQVEGRDIDGMSPDEVRTALRGAPGSSLGMVVEGLDGDRRRIEMPREVMLDPTVCHAEILDSDLGIAYVAITSFSRETSDELDLALGQLEASGMRALVLDLRANPGGVLQGAVQVARRFVREGVIVSTEGRGEPVVHRAVPAEARYAGLPTVVLIDGGTASAGEVLAAALQDHRLAVLVGSATHGKGVVQTVRRFPDRATIAKVTSSYYYTPAGRNLERDPASGREHGILPDVDVPISDSQRARVHGYLRRSTPPMDALDDLHVWQTTLGVNLLEPQPTDAQLEAALELLRGRRPGPWSEALER